MSSKTPPSKLKVESSYTKRENELLIWLLICGCGSVKTEQGITVLLQSLSENQKAEKAVSTLTSTYLNKDDRLNILLHKLDELFKTE